MHVSEDVNTRLNTHQFVTQEWAPEVPVARGGQIENSKRRCVGYQNVDPDWDAPPALGPRLAIHEVCEIRKVRTPRRPIDPQAAQFDEAVLEKLCVRKSKLALLEEKIVIAPDAEDVLCRQLGEPGIGISQRAKVILVEAANVPAMNQDVAGRDD